MSVDIIVCACDTINPSQPALQRSTEHAWPVWRVVCPACGKRSPPYLDRDYAAVAWNRGQRK